MLPGTNGFDVLRRIRAESEVPVIMLTARGDDTDRIVGLEIGADDYLPKPFNPRELVARVRAVLRRTHPKETKERSSRLVVGDLEMDICARTVHRQGEAISLTAVEFDFLEILLRNAGTVVSREHLAKAILDRDANPYDRSLDVHICNLRKKIGNRTAHAERIKTIRGEGYLYIRAAVSF
jgi:two-component system response regulator CpxR